MEASIPFPRDFRTGEQSWFFKCLLDGMTRGYAPRFARLNLPLLYHSRVLPRQDPEYGSGIEKITMPETSAKLGWVDCDRATFWRLCEQLVAQMPVESRVTWDGCDMHALVAYPPGVTPLLPPGWWDWERDQHGHLTGRAIEDPYQNLVRMYGERSS